MSYRNVCRISYAFTLTALSLLIGLETQAEAPNHENEVMPNNEPEMYFADEVSGKPFSKDPAVVRFGGRYLLYYSLPSYEGKLPKGWNIGIAESRDLIHWSKVGEIDASGPGEENGFCAPGAIVLDGKVHLFYQTYGNRENDAICHAWSQDGLNFTRNEENPVFRPTGDWNCGRAIDADVIVKDNQLLLYWSTRDPGFRIQMQGVSAASLDSGFGRDAWRQLNPSGPILAPRRPTITDAQGLDLRWEKDCIEAAAMCEHEGRLFMFYAGGYNNQPQQIGVAVSDDGVHFTRLNDGQPIVPAGKPGSWNSSESGHPFVFTDDDGEMYLFYQGNNDNGETWFLSVKRIKWKEGLPIIVDIEQDTPKQSANEPMPLADDWQLVGEAINESGWDVWGSSPVRTDDGRVHLFTARWPGDKPFDPAWRVTSEIAHYVSDSPTGPFRYVRTVLKGDGKGWDAQGLHNPNIQRIGDRYVLTYIANDGVGRHGPNQRIGMRVSDNIDGPWRPVHGDDDRPVLAPSDDPANWTHKSRCGVVNPTLLAMPDGRFFLYFKALPASGGHTKMGVAIADRLEGPYIIQSEPITANDRIIEDGYAFHWRGKVCLLTTDNEGIIERGGGLLWTSDDGLKFDQKPMLGFHHFGNYYFQSGVPSTAVYHYTKSVKLERPQVLIIDGEPAYLYAPSGAAIDGSDGTNCYVFKLQAGAANEGSVPRESVTP